VLTNSFQATDILQPDSLKLRFQHA